MSKKVFACVLCLVMMVSAVVSAANFKDVTKESHSWAYDAINDMAGKGIINGVSATEFAPDANVTKVQAMLLISRILGFNSSVVTENIESIYSIYEDDLASVNTSYKNELAYLLFRGVFSAEEIASANLDAQLSREEAALYITKAANGIEDMEAISVVLNAYSDDSAISEQYRKAVYYVRDEELMNGTGNNQFSPKSNVTRAQMATLLYRVMNQKDFNTEKGTVDSINRADNTAKIFVVAKTYDITSDVLIRNGGTIMEPKYLTKDDDVVVTMIDNTIVAIDIFKEVPVSTSSVDGEVIDVLTASNKIQLKDSVTGELSTYELEKQAIVQINGVESILPNVRIGDYVTLELTDDNKVAILKVSEMVFKLSDVVIDDVITEDDVVSLQLRDESDNVSTYVVNVNDLIVKKNGIKSEFSALNAGDKLSTVTLKYGRICEIEAFSEVKTASGVICEILISNSPSITLSEAGVTTTYPVGRDTVFYVYGEETDMYGLRLDYFAKVTLDSTVVAKVEIITQSQNANAFGVVQSVNTNANAVTFVDANGNTVVVYVSNSRTKIIDNDSTGAELKSINDIKPEDNITCVGIVTNGVFEAQTIVISR